jgi:hypothetical protein
MGDRANLVVETGDDERVFFYTHWGGSELPAALHRGLARKQRWDDPSYLARILFDELSRGHDIDDECRYGISGRIQDNEHDVLLVRPLSKTVELHGFNNSEWKVNGDLKEPIASWTFEEFLKVDPTWEGLTNGC